MSPFSHSWGPDRIRVGLRVYDVRDPRHVGVIIGVECVAAGRPQVLVRWISGFYGSIPVEQLRRATSQSGE
jgi:hypothetical protein